MRDPMTVKSETFFEIVVERTQQIACVIQARNEKQAYLRSLKIEGQLDHRHAFAGAVKARPATLPFRAATFSSGYFQVLDEIRDSQAS